jgi:cell division protein FtsB
MLMALFAGKKYGLYLFGMLALLLSVFMFFNMDQIREKLGFETVASLKVEIEKQNKVIEDMKAVVASKDREVNLLQTKIAISEKLTAELVIDKATLEKQVSSAKTKKDTAIEGLMKDKGIKDIEGLQTEPGVTAETVTEFKNEVSGISIDALWEVYCEGNEKCLNPEPSVTK